MVSISVILNLSNKSDQEEKKMNKGEKRRILSKELIGRLYRVEVGEVSKPWYFYGSSEDCLRIQFSNSDSSSFLFCGSSSIKPPIRLGSVIPRVYFGSMESRHRSMDPDPPRRIVTRINEITSQTLSDYPDCKLSLIGH
ncbi:MAG: hypothetical protein CEN91_71 [Candidatus Berkelbacteria bacterium Licking1014_85]|uniref:Uncharacterized protein n=1 Tax=Candidatus Berkelbacteria bacterium Licking1014_85 TaxID=2017148 RepID=A0A554LM14_9BACT|nr:MAG: hypothetical protein CEN91_71 [Candidatus Berkelbacteria bacterium Licking1014_85]